MFGDIQKKSLAHNAKSAERNGYKERYKYSQMQALNSYLRNFQCDWSEDMDASDRTMSVMDEFVPETMPV